MEQLNGGNEPPHESSNPTLSELTQALRDQPFLSGLKESQIEALALTAQQIEFPEQELIIGGGQPSQYFYLLLSGSVSIELNRGYFVVRIQHLGPGKAFGWSALLDNHDSIFDVRARENCTALRFENRGLAAVLRDDSVLAAELLRRALNLAAERMLATEKRLAELCGVSIATPKPEDAKPIISTLNRLIEVCLDGELGYRTAAQNVRSSTLRILLTDRGLRRRQAADELRAEVQRLGGNPSHSGDMAASLHRGWISLKSAVRGGDAHSIVRACETGEAAARSAYKAALDSGFLPKDVRLIVDAHSRAIHESREWLKQIDQELASEVQ